MVSKFQKPRIMGILNVTPDSFSDGGQYTAVDNALRHCRFMLEEGVDMIDVGGESTRPGARPVPAAEQIRRVVPVIRAIRESLSETLEISIDTTLAEVAEAALQAGATLVNDVSAGADAGMLDVVAGHKVPIVLMHMQGTPQTMQENPFYEDPVREIMELLLARVEAATRAGIKQENIILDPGIGFGKRKQDNLELLAHLQQFVNTGFPVLLGTSRKRFMGSICQVETPSELVTATAVTTALGVMAGVQIFRVHDVRENRQAADIAWAIKQAE